MTYAYTSVIVKEGRKFWAYIPDLPGVYGQGKSTSTAKRDLLEALKLYIEDCRADGDKIPSSHVISVKVEKVSLAA